MPDMPQQQQPPSPPPPHVHIYLRTQCHNRPFAKYQLSDGSPLVSMVSIDKNVKFTLNIRYFLKV
jgi:hypothetical protein